MGARAFEGTSQAMNQSFFTDPTLLAPPHVHREPLANGGFVLGSPEPLEPYARCTGEWLEQWARSTPEATALAERGAGTGAWCRISYRELRERVGRVAQGLLDLGLPAGKPIVVLSDNALDHALLLLAGQHIGVAVCTVSSAYSRLTKDTTKIRGILDTLDPALVYAADAGVYGHVLSGWAGSAVRVYSRGADVQADAQADTQAGAQAAAPAHIISFEQLASATESPAVMQAFAAIKPDDHAKYLLTSGSTGHPKVVINTHRMLCANQQMIAQTWRFLAQEKPVVVDWLPWSHTFGANHNFNLVLRNGGALYIDEGRPAPGLVEKTVTNLREVKPTLLFNVPRGFDMLLPFLEADDGLARDVLSRLRFAFYAGAALPQSTWERLDAVARRVRSEPLWLTTSWGSTETSPGITSAHWRLERAGCIGLPMPGMELKFVPNGEKLEMRVRGVSVFPGYRNAPELTAQAFDDEGYYLIGDAGLLVDAARPELGVAFNGRVAEDFKLGSGTWVSVGTLRLKAVSALAPLAQDVVVAGHDRNEVGVLVFPSAAAQGLSAADLAARVAAALELLKAEGGGSSQAPTRALVLSEPPSVDAGEITDKGYVNQGAVLRRRAADVMALYNDDDPRLIRPA